MPARRLLISGRVQGVFYRGWTVRQAEALGIFGWVRNLRDGRVEVLATGDEEALDELIRRCRQGPPAAEVRDIEISEAEPEPSHDFTQRPTA